MDLRAALFVLSCSVPASSSTCPASTYNAGITHYYYGRDSASFGFTQQLCANSGMEMPTFETAEEAEVFARLVYTAPDRTCHSALINPSSNSCSGSASCGARLRWVGQTSGVGSAVIDLFTSASSQGDVQYQVIRSTTETTMYTERRQASNGYYHNHCAICMCKDPTTTSTTTTSTTTTRTTTSTSTTSTSTSTTLPALDGGWSDWVNDTTCSATCGDGTLTHTRACDSPAPENGGAACAGSATLVEACNEGDCPPCPPMSGLQQVDSEHFFLEGDKGTFTEAQTFCSDRDLVLAPVQTQDEFDRLILATSIKEAWIDLHNPHYNVTCSDTGANCAGSLVLLDTSGAPADLSWWPEVKVDQADPARQCVKYKDDGGGKLEGEECGKDKHAACYIHCPGVNNCAAPHFFAFDGGSSCCDANECGGAAVGIGSTSCACGNAVQCTDASGNPRDNCVDAGRCLTSLANSSGAGSPYYSTTTAGSNIAFSTYENIT